MEIIKDCGIVLKIHEHGKTSQVVTVFSKENGVISGYHKGGNSAKKKSICITGNLLDFTWNARVISQLGTFEAEILQNFSSVFLEIHKSAIVNCVCEILLACLEKNDPHPEIFAIVLDFLQSLKTTGEKVTILKNYTVFETKLMSFLGFGYNFEKCNITGVGLPQFISPKTGNAVNCEVAKGFEDQLFPIPKFILSEAIEAKISDIKKMLDINLHFLKLHIDLQSLPVREFTINLF